MSKIFQNVGSLRPGLTPIDLSHAHKFTADMGQLIPVLVEEVVPGDRFEIANQALIRFAPLVAPIMHEINLFVHYFFVPYRILDANWEDFITSGPDGADVYTLPTWSPTNTAVGSLWDHFGFPTGSIASGVEPMAYPQYAYNLIWNEYYRDENLQAEIDITTNENILLRNWEKDYYTSALLEQQKGTAPALPISGTTSAVFGTGAFVQAIGDTNIMSGTAQQKLYINSATGITNVQSALNNNNTVDLSVASTFDIADLRLAFQIQRWMERNNRAGNRYTEFLKAHFGLSPRDERLQRPEYIGGTRAPVIVSEVLQTSSTDATSPQGNLAGHGLTVGEGYAGKYSVKEYGVIIGMFSVIPRTGYSQGINRQWLRRTRYDFYFPEFAHLSEQAILNGELLAIDTGNVGTDTTHNQGIFGYQGRYDELRYKPNKYTGLMRTDLSYWHLGREFSDLTPPALNEAFIQCVPRKDIFAAPTEPGLIVDFGNVIKAIRPIPYIAEPGLIDHDY